MSYTIIYGKQFVKLDEQNHVPVLNWGDNNVYEFNNRKRARDFTQARFFTDNEMYATKETMLQKAQELRKRYQERDPEYSDTEFGYWASLAIGGSTRKTTFRKLINIVIDGIKKSRTVEDLLQHGINVNVYEYAYTEEEFEKKHGRKPIRMTMGTSEELKRFLDNYSGPGLTISIDAWADQLKRLNARNIKPKSPKVVDHFFHLVTKEGYSFLKCTKRGYRHRLFGYGKQFETEAQAERYMKSIKYPEAIKEVRRVDQQTTFLTA